MSKKALNAAAASTAATNSKKSLTSQQQEITLIHGHYTYEKVSLKSIKIELDKSHQPVTKIIYDKMIFNFRIRVYPVRVNPAEQAPCFTLLRNYDDFVELDNHIHSCPDNCSAYNNIAEKRNFTGLCNLKQVVPDPKYSEEMSYQEVRDLFAEYIDQLNTLIKREEGKLLKCNECLNWFKLDNMGRHIVVIHDNINQPGVYTAQCIKEYQAQCQDEMSMKPNDAIQVLKICKPSESGWWYGKNQYDVGYFPYDCIKLLEGNFTELMDCLAPGKTSAVAKKHGKKIVTLKELLEKRPKEEELRRKKILKDRDAASPANTLADFMDQSDKVPWLVEVSINYIEKFGIVSGVYRKPGSVLNVELLNKLFSREKQLRITADELDSYTEIKNDQYCVASFLKQFFRDLKQPLITFKVFEKCMESHSNIKDKQQRKDAYITALQDLSSDHWNTLKLLMTHLYKLSAESHITNMNTENLARIWSGNLVRRDEESQVMTPTSDMDAIASMRANVYVNSEVICDLIEMVPQIFGYQKTESNIDSFLERRIPELYELDQPEIKRSQTVSSPTHSNDSSLLRVQTPAFEETNTKHHSKSITDLSIATSSSRKESNKKESHKKDSHKRRCKTAFDCEIEEKENIKSSSSSPSTVEPNKKVVINRHSPKLSLKGGNKSSTTIIDNHSGSSATPVGLIRADGGRGGGPNEEDTFCTSPDSYQQSKATEFLHRPSSSARN